MNAFLRSSVSACRPASVEPSLVDAGRRGTATRLSRCAAVASLCVAVASILVAPAATIAADAAHAADGHGDDHGHGHGPEIGHNIPAGSTQAAFESPAWFQTDLAVWSFVVFLGLLGLLTKFAWKPIMQGLEKREQGIVDTIASANRANDEAKRMLASYERRLAEASEEVRGMLEEARRDADVTRQTIVAEARKAAEEEKARARHEIGLAKDDALAAIADRAGDLAVEVAGKFLREKLGREDQARLVRDSVAGIGGKPSVN